MSNSNQLPAVHPITAYVFLLESLLIAMQDEQFHNSVYKRQQIEEMERMRVFHRADAFDAMEQLSIVKRDNQEKT